MTFFPLLSEGVQIAQMYAQIPGGIESATAVAIASSGTITTSGPPQIGATRLSPASAVTGVIMQKGSTPGQECWVVNEAVAANTITMAASGTSNVAGGVNEVIPGLQARFYVWDDQTNLWYSTPQLATSTSLTQSGSAAVIGGAGTITTASVGVARLAPTAARTGIIMQAGTVAGQLCLVVNEATVEKTLQMDVSGTSNVADGINCIIPGLSAKLFIWDSGTSLWYASYQTTNGTINFAQSATTPDPGAGGTITTNGVGVARVTPASSRTGIILQAGQFPGQMVTVINNAAAAVTLTFNTTPATANVADSATQAAIAGLTARTFVWDSVASLWYQVKGG